MSPIPFGIPDNEVQKTETFVLSVFTLFLFLLSFQCWIPSIYNAAWYILAAAAKSLQSCPTLCNPIDGSPPGSPVPGIPQARTLEWVAISFSNAWKWKVKSEREVVQSCLTLSDPMDCSPPGSSVHGIFQAGVLEWGAIAFSMVYSSLKIIEWMNEWLNVQNLWHCIFWYPRDAMLFPMYSQVFWLFFQC